LFSVVETWFLRLTYSQCRQRRDGILENPVRESNTQVFHKSLSLLWIANVDYCRQVAKSRSWMG